MRLRKRKKIDAYIPTGSMADIAFLLIIFFMVTTKFDVDRTQVLLPKSQYREEVPKGSAYVVIHRYDDDTYGYKFSNGEDQSFDVPDMSALAANVNSLAAVNPTKPFIIKADGDTPYRMIDETMDMLRQAGVENLVLLTEQQTVDEEA